MTKSLANKIHLKERFYTFCMAEGAPVQKHLNEFSSILADLESLDVKIEDEDKTILLVVSLPPSYKHFKEIILYNNSNTISFEDVKSNLLSKDKFDLHIHTDFGEGLVVRDKTTKKSNGNRSKNRSKSKNPHAGKTCNYCGKLGHIVADCWQLQKKREKEENNSHKPAEVSFAESDSTEDVLFATSTKKGSDYDWILDFGCTYHMCPHKD